jgi:hypothetical protein
MRLAAELVVFEHSVVLFNNGSTRFYVQRAWSRVDNGESANQRDAMQVQVETVGKLLRSHRKEWRARSDSNPRPSA